MIIIFRRPYVTDLLWICLEVNEIATASIIYEEIMKKGPISSDDYEMIPLKLWLRFPGTSQITVDSVLPIALPFESITGPLHPFLLRDYQNYAIQAVFQSQQVLFYYLLN